MRQISLQGHRGARGLLAENTLASLIKPFEFGMDGIEFDVQLSRDDKLVIYHDLRLKPEITRDASNRWVDKNGPPVRSLTLNQLKQYRLGRIKKSSAYGMRFRKQTVLPDQTIPSLYDLVEHLDRHNLGHVTLNIEIKHSPLDADLCPSTEHMAKVIVDEIRNLNISRRCILQSFNWAVIKHVRALDHTLPISCLTTGHPAEDTVSARNGSPSPWTGGLDVRDFNNNVVDMVLEFNADYWAPNVINLNKTQLERAHAHHLAVMTWTVNHILTMKRLMNWGVDAIITDYPDRLEAAFQQWKSTHTQ